MKTLLLIVIVMFLSGCATWSAMSDAEKASVIVGFVATTAIISSNSNGDTFIREEICQPRGQQTCGD